MDIKILKKIITFLKLGIFLSLFVVFYVYYFSEVAKKYAEKTTWVSTTQGI